jgi:hypothetical protein
VQKLESFTPLFCIKVRRILAGNATSGTQDRRLVEEVKHATILPEADILPRGRSPAPAGYFAYPPMRGCIERMGDGISHDKYDEK